MSKKTQLGACTLYGLARKHGYTGTEEEYVNQEQTYVTQAQEAQSSAATSASAASTSATNAATSEANAKTYADNAFSGTPDGYAALVNNVNDVMNAADGTVTGELKEDLVNEYITKSDGIIPQEATENLLIYDAMIDGAYYDANGKLLKASDWWCLPLIKVEASTYYSAGVGRICFYDSSKTFISDLSVWGGLTFETAENVAYIGFCSNQSKTSAYLYLNSAIPRAWVKGEKLIAESQVKGLSDKTTNFENRIATIEEIIPEKLTSDLGKNLFDKKGTYRTLVSGYYVEYNTGFRQPLSDYEYEIIPVTVGDTLIVNATNIHVAFFKSNTIGRSTYVSGLVANKSTSFVVPENATYMTVSIAINIADSFQIEKGTTPTSYESFVIGLNAGRIIGRTESKPIVTIGSTGCEYTNICLAIKEHQSNTIFKLLGETFDVVSAYEEVYGSDYFTNYAGYATYDVMDRGLNLGDGCELYGEAGTIIDYEYTGSNETVYESFSVFSTTQNNVISNVTIKINGKCRYHIHEDYATTAGTNIFEKIVFVGNNDDPGRPAIGAGMGTDNTYIVRNCAFLGTTRAIGWHNNVGTAKNKLIVEGCYFNGPVYLFHYGTSEAKTTLVLLHDCRVTEVILMFVDETTFPNANFDLYKWNNEVAS